MEGLPCEIPSVNQYIKRVLNVNFISNWKHIKNYSLIHLKNILSTNCVPGIILNTGTLIGKKANDCIINKL